MRIIRTGAFLGVLLASSVLPARAADAPLTRAEVEQGLKKAVRFFRTSVARKGGYLWEYSGDLELAEGEGKVGKTTVWVQPPGTPSVGLAYLTAYEATGDPDYLEAARETAGALLQGQLRSGGWTARIDFDPADRKRYAYRVEAKNKGRDVTSLDDNTSQEAIRFLLRLDHTLKAKDAVLHEATNYALSHLLEAQYPNGAWPQGFRGVPEADKFPVKKASYPPDWRKLPRRKDYWVYYTLNDNALMDTLEVCLLASRLTGEKRYREAAEKAGTFLIQAQMPEPQPAWAQQYDADMYPAWARKFEPPAISGSESQGALNALLLLFGETGDRKYLAPIPRALDYLKRSRLPDGRLARFYELKSNKPLYFNRKYELTYATDDLPTHYGFLVPSRLDRIETEYQRLRTARPAERIRTAKPSARKVAAKVRAALAALDGRGAWVEKGQLRFHKLEPKSGVIRCRTFCANVRSLSEWLAATR